MTYKSQDEFCDNDDDIELDNDLFEIINFLSHKKDEEISDGLNQDEFETEIEEDEISDEEENEEI